jgi:hypothetical protein
LDIFELERTLERLLEQDLAHDGLFVALLSTLTDGPS